VLNQLWKEIQKITAITTDVNKRFKEAQLGEEKYKADLASELAARQMVQEAKEKLVRTAINRSLETHDVRNVLVDSDVQKKFVDAEGFNEKAIDRFIEKNYVENADALAFQQLLKEVKRLLPVFWDEKGQREPSVKDIVKGCKIVLHIYWSYGSIYDTSQIVALEKLISMLLLKEKASKAEDLGMATIINMARAGVGDYAQAKSYVFDNRFIKGFRIYKNGKFEIEFKKEKYAKRVARALIS